VSGGGRASVTPRQPAPAPRGTPTSATRTLPGRSRRAQTFARSWPRSPWAIPRGGDGPPSAAETFPARRRLPNLAHTPSYPQSYRMACVPHSEFPGGATCWTSVLMRTTVGIVTHFVQISKECICRESSSIGARVRTWNIKSAGSSLGQWMRSHTSALGRTQGQATAQSGEPSSAKEASRRSPAS